MYYIKTLTRILNICCVQIKMKLVRSAGFFEAQNMLKVENRFRVAFMAMLWPLELTAWDDDSTYHPFCQHFTRWED